MTRSCGRVTEQDAALGVDPIADRVYLQSWGGFGLIRAVFWTFANGRSSCSARLLMVPEVGIFPSGLTGAPPEHSLPEPDLESELWVMQASLGTGRNRDPLSIRHIGISFDSTLMPE